MQTGRLEFRCTSAESFELRPGEAPFDLAFAIRVGALDGRHPAQGARALLAIKRALRPGARLYIDGGVSVIGLRLVLPPGDSRLVLATDRAPDVVEIGNRLRIATFAVKDLEMKEE